MKNSTIKTNSASAKKETNAAKAKRILKENADGAAKIAKEIEVKVVEKIEKAEVQEEVKVVTVAKKKISSPIVSNRQIYTRSTHGKIQQRTTGSRRIKNNWGHYEGTIGAKIDNMISKGNFTKKQIESYAGTKMSKVNSHINHLRKEKMFPVSIDSATKIVSFA